MFIGATPRRKLKLLEIDDVAQRCKIVTDMLKDEVKNLNLLKDFEHLRPKDPRVN
jgi:hypothetical protein